MWIAVVAIIGVAAVIAIAELVDARNNKRQRRIMREGVKTTGTVTLIEHRSAFVKSNYRWEVSVNFEYEGNTYALWQGSIAKPVLRTGDHVTVYVNRKAPWKSFFEPIL